MWREPGTTYHTDSLDLEKEVGKEFELHLRLMNDGDHLIPDALIVVDAEFNLKEKFDITPEIGWCDVMEVNYYGPEEGFDMDVDYDVETIMEIVPEEVTDFEVEIFVIQVE